MTSKNNLALCIQSQGQSQNREAEKLIREVLQGRGKFLKNGKENAEYWTAYHNLGGVMYAGGRYREAEEVGREALVARERILGLNYPANFTTMNHIALALTAQNKDQEAEYFSRRSASGRANHSAVGKNHPHTRQSLATLNRILKKQGKPEESMVDILDSI